MRLPLVPSLGALFVAVSLCGCLDTATPADFCRARVTAECDKEASCQGGGDAQACITARIGACATETEATLCGAGKTFDAGQASQCVSGIRSADCTGLNRGDRPAGCFAYCR